jgi:uncharacterized protein YxjI
MNHRSCRIGDAEVNPRSGHSAGLIQSRGEKDLHAKGNLVDHEYEITRDCDTIANVSKRWFRVRDTCGVEIAEGEDEALVLAITICIDAMSDPRD